MSSDNQVALSRMTRGTPGALSKATRQVVPPFLQKLYEMVSDSATDNLIRWSDTGDSFFVLDHERVAHDVLPRWFKHNNFASFVRQLNMYGFHKIPHLQQGVLKSETETEIWNFEHQSFQRGRPDMLCLITRKKQAPERQADDAQPGDKDGAGGCAAAGLSAGSLVDINSIINGITAIKRHQATISADLNDLKSSNQHLWQEALEARERHKKQQDTINRILKFLAGVFGNSATSHKGSPTHDSPHPGIPRKRQRLMIEGGEQSRKQVPLEPLDGEDPIIETPGDDSPPLSRFVEVSPSSVPPKTATGALMNPEVTISSAQLSSQPSRPAEVLMNGNFTSQTPFVPYSNPVSSSDSTMFSPSFVNSDNAISSSALTSTSQNAGNHDVLQAIANSPGQLQRLLHLLNLQQQQNAPMPPPLDLNAPSSDVSNHFSEVFSDPSSSLQRQQSPITPLAIPDNFSLVEPDQQALSLLQADELSPMSFEPFLANENQLQKTHRDAAAISEDIDAIQMSLDSLINNLGFDPSQVTNMHDADLQAQSDVNSLYASAQADPIPGSSLTSESPVPTIFASESSTATNDTSSTTNTDSMQFQRTIPEFDFNAFINELARQQNSGDTGGAGYTGLNSDGDDTLVKGSNNDVASSPRLSAFVDEVTSQSDVSSPSMRRASIIYDPVVPAPATEASPNSLKKARKRKSDMNQIGSERTQIKTKRKR